MTIFKRKPPAGLRLISCPLCQASLIEGPEEQSHWDNHVHEIPAGEGDASGQYTWNCSCGSPRMKWPGRGAASLCLRYHLQRAHGIPVATDVEVFGVEYHPYNRHLARPLS